MKAKTVAIIGAGIVGVTTAYQLSKAGYHVKLIDADKSVALRTSYANGGQLSYSYIDAMSSLSLLKKMPRILLGLDPAFHVKISLTPKYITWGSRFLSNARTLKEQANTRNNLRLSLYSRDEMAALLAEIPISFKHRSAGKLHLYTKQADLQGAKSRVNQKEQWGCPQEILDARQCLLLEPNLSQLNQEIVGGVYSKIDDVGDAPSFANTLMEIMLELGTLETYFSCKVKKLIKKGNNIEGLETAKGIIKADAYVLATGAESLYLATDIGLNIPLMPIKGYSVTVPATSYAPEVSITDMDNKVVFAKIGNNLRIAGLADIVGSNIDDDKGVDQSRINHLLNVAKKVFPKAGDYNEILHQWVGFRPVTPSSVPIIGQVGIGQVGIGQSGAANLYLNMGHGMFGWTLAMGSASLLTAIINQDTLPIDMSGMRPEDHGIRYS